MVETIQEHPEENASPEVKRDFLDIEIPDPAWLPELRHSFESGWLPDQSRPNSPHTTTHSRSPSEIFSIQEIAHGSSRRDKRRSIRNSVRNSIRNSVPVPNVQPEEDTLPTKRRLAILMICACMAIFLQALVSQ